jgi:DNA (cytosine-5)-methyltransferase 1
MKILNLYAGIGGNRKLWSDKHEVTAVEYDPAIAAIYADLYPEDTLIVGDAHEYLTQHFNEFDFIWSSPPCQSHSSFRQNIGVRYRGVEPVYPDMKLYQEILFLQANAQCGWVVENVKPYYEPLIKPTAILGRHYFWSNFDISQFDVPSPKGFITAGTAKETEKLKEWLGIHYEGNIYYKNNHCPGQVLRNCVHPDLGLHVFNESRREGLFSF